MLQRVTYVLTVIGLFAAQAASVHDVRAQEVTNSAPDLQALINAQDYTDIELRNIDRLLDVLETPQGLEEPHSRDYFCEDFQAVGQPPFATLKKLYGQPVDWSAATENVERVAKDVLAKGDRVYAEIHTTATHVGPLFGVPGSGEEIFIYEKSFFRFSSDGKICEARRMVHEADLFKQLGGKLSFPIDERS